MLYKLAKPCKSLLNNFTTVERALSLSLGPPMVPSMGPPMGPLFLETKYSRLCRENKRLRKAGGPWGPRSISLWSIRHIYIYKYIFACLYNWFFCISHRFKWVILLQYGLHKIFSFFKLSNVFLLFNNRLRSLGMNSGDVSNCLNIFCHDNHI